MSISTIGNFGQEIIEASPALTDGIHDADRVKGDVLAARIKGADPATVNELRANHTIQLVVALLNDPDVRTALHGSNPVIEVQIPKAPIVTTIPLNEIHALGIENNPGNDN